MAKKVFNPETALVAADAFRAHAQPFLEFIGDDMNEAHKLAVQDLGGMIASASCLALATELYAKALHMVIGQQVPKTHDLWTLFKRLPPSLRESIQKRYQQPSEAPRGVAELEVAMSYLAPSDALSRWEARQPRSREQTLEAVLKRSKDAFETWRYLHEGAVEGDVGVYRYEFYRLGLAAEALRHHVVWAFAERRRQHGE